MSNDDLISAAKEASRGASTGSAAHEQTADEIATEMGKRYNNRGPGNEDNARMDPNNHF
jgi:hypothetical protein